MRFTRRKRRLVFTVAGSAIFIILAISLILLTRPSEKPYIPGEKTEGIINSLGREVPGDHPRVRFANVTEEAGINFRHFYGERTTQLPEDMGSGAAWGDYNNDGALDLFVVNIAGALTLTKDEIARSPVSNRLYKNDMDGTFTDVTGRAGVGARGYGMGAAWGDYDSDGDLDLAVTNYGVNLLYRNDGNDIFTEISKSAGIGDVEGFWASVSWADYDNDGYLDLYICGYVKYTSDQEDSARASKQYEVVIPFTLNPSSYSPERNLLYHNNGDGTFTEVAQQAGVDNVIGRSLSASWCDFDRDGWVDLYVANDVSDNVMYKNNGDGTFTDISHEAWVADYRGAMGLAVGDWSNDGDMDIFVTHWIAQENALYENLLAEMSGLETGDTKSQSEAPGLRFTDVADAYGLGQIALDYIGWGTAFFDYNNDGRLDLFVVNGSTFQDSGNEKELIKMSKQLFWNKGDEGFFAVESVSGDVFAEEWVGRGAAFADYDNDGDVDIFIVNHSAPPQLLRNDGGNANRWLKVRLKGIQSNKLGVGTKLAISYDSGTGVNARQIREMGSGSSYLSQNPMEAVFGCGDATEISSLEVLWPSGTKQLLESVPTNQIIEVTEGKGWQVMADAPGTDSKPEQREKMRQFWEVYRRAIRMMKTEGDWEKSTDLFREALAIDPDHEDSIYYLGNSLLGLGHYQEALAQFQRLVEIDPRSLRGNLQIGAVHAYPDTAEFFDLGKAEKSFQRALTINPEESGSLLQLGAVLLMKGDLERASEYFSMARQLNFKAVDAYYLDGYIQWTQEDMNAAMTLLSKAIKYSHPQKPERDVLGEGDTKRADGGALTSVAIQRPFSEQIAALKERELNEVITEEKVIEEYEQLRQYLTGLRD